MGLDQIKLGQNVAPGQGYWHRLPVPDGIGGTRPRLFGAT